MSSAPEVNCESPDEGSGARNDRAASGLSETRDARLTAMAISRGWVKPGRFRTHEPQKLLAEELESRGDMTSAEEAVLIAGKLMKTGKPRSMGIGAKLVLGMEQINQRDDFASLNAGTDPQAQGVAPVAPNEIAAAMDSSVPNMAAG